MAKQIKREVTGEGVLTVPVGISEIVGHEAAKAQGGKIKVEESSVQHININIGRENAEKFLKIRNGLRAKGALLSNNREVYSNADVFRWMLENLQIKEAEKEAPKKPAKPAAKPAATPLQTAADL